MAENNKFFIDVDDIKPTTFGAVRENAVENGRIIKKAFKGSFDIVVKKGYCAGKCIVFANCDGLCNSQKIADNAIRPLLSYDGTLPEGEELEFICDNIICGTEQKKETSLDIAVDMLLRGTLLIFVEGSKECVIFGVQAIPERAISEPDTDVQEFGSREGFTENMKTNLTLVRKRLCTSDFTIEMQEHGLKSKTRILLCYMKGRVDPDILNEVKSRLNGIDMDTVLGAGYLRKALDTKRLSFFTMVGQTERPDTFAAKICEGKIGIIIDGTPFALIVPRLFIENFQTLDDYINRPFFATFMRIVRFLAFLISVFLPGIFVAVGLFHQEMLPDDMLYNIVVMESNTLFTLTLEALIIHFVYETVREAGLRMPKSIGHAVSIVGALVIGDAAVTAGLIGAPMLIIVALTAICSLVSSDLYQPISVLRIIFIVIGGATGLYGIMIGAAALVISLASMTDYGIPFLAPVSPFKKEMLRDSLVRISMEKLGKNIFDINKLKFKNK
ncbi:MAG: spore germination protein [Clostridia bacterium]|nr:spore germination protein [Clostridia bacterium]